MEAPVVVAVTAKQDLTVQEKLEAKLVSAEKAVVDEAKVVEKDVVEFLHPTSVIETDAYTPPKGSYRAIRLTSFALGNGTKVLPNAFGYYEPKTKEEKDLLNYYDLLNKGLVELTK